MNREQYLKKLQHYLKRLPKDDYENAMEYFIEYFDEAGEEHAAEVMQELGTPQEAAAELLSSLLREKTDFVGGNASSAQKNGGSRRYRSGDPLPETSRKHSPFSIVIIVILSICAAPIAAPLAVAALALLLTGVILVFTLVLCVFICSAAAVIAGIYSVIMACGLIPSSIGGTLIIAGAGLLCTGFGILFFVAGLLFCKWLVVLLAQFIQKRIDKRRRKKDE